MIWEEQKWKTKTKTGKRIKKNSNKIFAKKSLRKEGILKPEIQQLKEGKKKIVNLTCAIS